MNFESFRLRPDQERTHGQAKPLPTRRNSIKISFVWSRRNGWKYSPVVPNASWSKNLRPRAGLPTIGSRTDA
ncbi:hypothetical protein RJ640_029070, partial [Escallonia rubra]